jgi:hypothetical protein
MPWSINSGTAEEEKVDNARVDELDEVFEKEIGKEMENEMTLQEHLAQVNHMLLPLSAAQTLR